MAPWARLLTIVAALSCAQLGSAQTTAKLSGQPNLSQPNRVAGLPPEVRLRRLHLVRPDLIPYPIEIEVFC